MRLNPLHPSDNPMEELLFCFGGPSDSGDTGGAGKQDAQMNELDQISADFDNMSQQQAAGESVTSGMSGGVGRGGSSNDNDGDGIPNSIDATPGVDRSSIGAAAGPGSFDAFDASKGYLDQAISNFAAGPGPAAGSGDGLDIGYRGPMATGPTDLLAGPASNLGPQTGGFRATPATMDDVEAQQARAQAASVAAQQGLPGIASALPGGTTTSKTGPTAVDNVVDSIAEALGLTAPSVSAGIANLGPVSATKAAGVEAAREVGRQAARDAFAAGELTGNLQPSGIAPAETPAIEAGREAAFNAMAQGARDAALGPTAMSYDPTEPEGGAIGVQGMIDAAKANTQQNISSGSPTPSTVSTAAAMEDANIPGAEAPVGLSGMPGYTGPSQSQQGLAVNRALDTLSSQAAAQSPMNPVQATPGMQMIADVVNTLDMYGGTGKGNVPGYVENVMARPGAMTALTSGIQMNPVRSNVTDFDAFDPSKNTSEERGTFEQSYVEGADGTESIMGAVGPNRLSFLPGQPDNIYVGTPQGYDQLVDQGNLVPESTEYVGDPNAPEPESDQQGGGDSTTMPPEVAPVAPQTCPDGYTYDASSDSCVYQGQNIVQMAQYTPAQAPGYNYTGLPSLAPVSLKPSFQARGQYSPLFPMV